MDEAVAAKLAKLLRMLASSHDNESLVSARKIVGIVAAHDIDWDATLAGGMSEAQMREIYSAGYQRGLADGARQGAAPDWTDTSRPRAEEIGARFDEVMDLIDAGQSMRTALSDFERSFIDSMAERLETYGYRTFVSEKQWQVIERLRRKMGR